MTAFLYDKNGAKRNAPSINTVKFIGLFIHEIIQKLTVQLADVILVIESVTIYCLPSNNTIKQGNISQIQQSEA